jgi:two-component system NtrC family response regulator
MIQKAVELYGCNHSRIAAALGLSRQTLYRRLEKYDIKLPE